MLGGSDPADSGQPRFVPANTDDELGGQKQSPHYHFYSLERFFIAKAVRNLKCMMLLQLLNSSCWTDSSGFSTFLATAIVMMFFEDDLNRLRPSNFYPPEGFYPTGC